MAVAGLAPVLEISCVAIGSSTMLVPLLAPLKCNIRTVLTSDPNADAGLVKLPVFLATLLTRKSSIYPFQKFVVSLIQNGSVLFTVAVADVLDASNVPSIYK